jgi:hypothetical protein
LKPLTNKQIEAAWGEAKKKGAKMRQPVGFGGSGVWAIVILLVGGVIWIENRFGPNIAGAAILGVFLLLAFLAGQLTNIAARQAEANARIGEMEATAAIEKERIRGDNMIAKVDAQMQMKQFLFMLGMIKQLMKEEAKQPAQLEDPKTIDLEAIRAYRWTEDDL